MKLKNCLIVPLLLAAAWANAQEPTAKITAPASVPAGQMVWIKTDGSVADDYAWYTSAPSHTFNISDDKRTVMFQTVETKTYLFLLAVVKDNKIAMASAVIAVGEQSVNPPSPGPDDPSPGPSPNPAPTPVTDLSNAVKILCEKTVPSPSRSKARNLSAEIRSLCTFITSDLTNNTFSWTPRLAREEFVRRNRSVLGEDAQQWAAFSNELNTLIVTHFDGNIVDAKLVVETWLQVAAGLEAVE